MDKLQMKSNNLVDENIEFIAKRFPNCVTEALDEEGKLTKLVDFDMLKQELSHVVIDGDKERYTMTWPDKKQAILTANAPIAKTLRPCREESVDFDHTENLYIEGDNLDVLKLLRETYLGKIKMIYIDPPYNTGNDFVYNDDFAVDTEEYLERSNQVDDQGNRMVANNDSNGRFHTDWLNMIYPRLKLAKDLLSDDGVIFISIDDNEIDNLLKICNEIYGEANNIAILCVELSKTQGMKVASAQNGQIVKNHEYILVYSKNTELASCNRQPLYDKAERFDNHFDIIYRNGELTNLLDFLAKDEYSLTFFNQFGFKINKENIKKILELSEEYNDYFKNNIAKFLFRKSMISSTEIKQLDLKENIPTEYGKYILIKNSAGTVEQLQSFYETLKKTDEYSPTFDRATIRGALWKGFYSDMMNIAKEGGIPYKNGKKPIRLIKQLAKWTNRKDSIVLDFFAGSCSTAHAIMQLNAEDGGNRKFIMVQIPEKIDKKNELFSMGFENLCEVGKERIRRAGQKIKEENPNTTDLDIGFRCLKLDSSCMKDIYYSPNKTTQDLLTQFEDNIKEDRTPEDLLFQVMLDMGVMLSSEIKTLEINGKKVFNVNDGDLVCCFDKNINDEVVTAIAKMKPLYAVFRDASMSTDSVAVNFDQIFETYSPTTTRKVI